MYISNDRSELILSLLDNFSHINVITDLGCMDGATLSGISSSLPGNIIYYVIDYASPEPKITSDTIIFVKCDLNTHLSKIDEIIKRTDLILLLDVLEHLHHPEVFLKELNEIMKPESQLLIIVPNAASVRKLIAWIKNDFPRNEIGYFDKTHRSWFTTKSIKCLIPPKLSLDRIGYIYSEKTIFRIFQKLLPSRLTSQFYVRLSKK